jgi:hypothetical protein
MKLARHILPRIAAALLITLPFAAPQALELSGTKSVVATTADGARLVIGTVQFTPAQDGSASFALTMNHALFSDHFLSMREFKCLPGASELSCHVPYPYANPRTVSAGQYAWLEHSLLFFYKLPSEFGAKLWNGIYFELQPSAEGLVGTPQAIDLNAISAPPADLTKPPFRRALRDDMPPQARWIRSLSIE